MEPTRLTTRRDFLGAAGTALVAASMNGTVRAGDADAAESPAGSPQIKSVAAIVTIYRANSHSDVILGKILSGWKHDGGPGPALRLASLYVDQFPADDMARSLSRQYGFPIYDNIADALTLGSDRVAVDGVISIGEHGEYPWNEKEQHLYPRRRFFSEIADTLELHRRVVPVFNDKHLGPEWTDALWMYERAKQLDIPFMAGSSLAVGTRDPDKTLPWGAKVDACLGIGYSGRDIYGFHTLDYLQAILERRENSERGVRWVQCMPGLSIPQMIQNGTLDGEMLDAGLRASQTNREQLLSASLDDCDLFMMQYDDGLVAPVLMLPGIASAISATYRIPGQKPTAIRVEERPEPRYPHFAYLLKGIERMIHSGQPSYPVERTLLTSGMLDRLLTSRVRGGQRLETPELAIRYQPKDYSYAPHLNL